MDYLERITDKNFIAYAEAAYRNPICLNEKEFLDDLKHIKYVKRLLNRYQTTGELKERLILNHITILGNVFGVIHATRILFFKLDKKYWSDLKTFLVYLNYMPEHLPGIGDDDIISTDIQINLKIAALLREIK
jgi:hypothetical protein